MTNPTAGTVAETQHTAGDRSRARRLGAFLLERFLPVPQLLLVTLVFLAGVTFPVVLAGGDQQPIDAAGWWRLLAAYVGTVLLFLHLRLMDDVKDADHDREHEPDRPIPRGLASEREIDAVAAAVMAVEGVLFAAVGTVPLIAWALTAGYTVLMRLEFFVGPWLERRVFAYALSHMVSMALLFAMLHAAGSGIFLTGSGDGVQYLPPDLIVACAASFCLGMGFELGRKFERYHDAHEALAWTLWVLFPCAGAIAFTYLAGEHYRLSAELTLAAVSLVGIILLARTMGRRPQGPGSARDKFDESFRGRIEVLPAALGLLTYLPLAMAGILVVIG